MGEGRDEGGILVPKAQAVAKHVDALDGAHRAVLLGLWGGQQPEGLVELARR